jgi:hypothetical protein
VLSEQDARAFCLAMAQVIPTLLVAFYVVDRMVKPSIDLSEDRAAPSYEDVKNNLEEVRELVKRTQTTLVEEVKTKAVPQEEGMESFNLRWSELETSKKRSEVLGFEVETMRRGEEDVIRSANSEQMKTYRVYLIGIFVTILFGAVGEAASVAGSLGVLNLEASIALASIAAFNILGSLASHSWHRLFAFKNDDKLTRRFYWWGLFSAQSINLGLFILIPFNLHVES